MSSAYAIHDALGRVLVWGWCAPGSQAAHLALHQAIGGAGVGVWPGEADARHAIVGGARIDRPEPPDLPAVVAVGVEIAAPGFAPGALVDVADADLEGEGEIAADGVLRLVFAAPGIWRVSVGEAGLTRGRVYVIEATP